MASRWVSASARRVCRRPPAGPVGVRRGGVRRFSSGQTFIGSYENAIVGCGPAGIGPLVVAAKHGRLATLLHAGLLIIEGSDGRWGSGNIGQYLITANSQAEDFIEFVPEEDEPGPWRNGGDLGVFDEIRATTEFRVLHDIAHGKVVINDEPGKCTLEQLGDFTGAVGEILVRRVAAAPGCKLLPQSKVRQLRIMSANESSLVIDIAGCSTVTAQVGSVVLATGAPSTACTSPESKLPHSGKYTLPSEIADAQGEQIPCFTPQGERGLGTPMFSADLAQRTVGFERIRATLAAVEPPAERRIALIGSSHGAFSTGQLLYDRLRPEFPDLQLDICARSAVRVFRSPEEAESYDLQEFDSVDPDNGAVNRFSGIRSPARDFYWAVENGEVDGCSVRFFTPEEMQGGPDIPPSGPFADETLSSASLIVTATGYRTNVPPVCVQLPNGRFFPLEWCINRPFDQQIRVSNDSLQCAVWHPQQPNNPTFLARVYGIGLGYGITGAANERKDGVNFYHMSVGEKLLNGLLVSDLVMTEQLVNGLAACLLLAEVAEGEAKPRERLQARLAKCCVDMGVDADRIRQQDLGRIMREALRVNLSDAEVGSVFSHLQGAPRWEGARQVNPRSGSDHLTLPELQQMDSLFLGKGRWEIGPSPDRTELTPQQQAAQQVFKFLDSDGSTLIRLGDLQVAFTTLGFAQTSQIDFEAMLENLHQMLIDMGGPRFIGRAGGDDEVHDPHPFTSDEWERLANAAW